MTAGDFAFFSAVPAENLQGEGTRFYQSPFCYGFLRQNIQIHLDTFWNDAAERSHGQADNLDTGGVLLLGGF